MNAPFNPPVVHEPQPYRFEAAQFLRLIAAGLFADRHVELVNGEIIQLPPPSPKHGRFQARLVVLLAPAFASRVDLWVGGDTAILIDEDTVLGCDVVIAEGSDDGKALQPGKIALAIEISESTIGYDLGAKSSAYARAKVAALWVVDPQASVVHVFAKPHDGNYQDRDIVRFGKPLAVPGTDQTITIA